MGKASYKYGLQLVEEGTMTQEQLDEAISRGLIASERQPGGGKAPRAFVSEAQKQFYDDKVSTLASAKKAVEKAVANFMQTYGADWSDDGKLEFAVYVKGFKKAFDSFQPE